MQIYQIVYQKIKCRAYDIAPKSTTFWRVVLFECLVFLILKGQCLKVKVCREIYRWYTDNIKIHPFNSTTKPQSKATTRERDGQPSFSYIRRFTLRGFLSADSWFLRENMIQYIMILCEFVLIALQERGCLLEKDCFVGFDDCAVLFFFRRM